MKVKDYLQTHEWSEVSFIIAKAVKDDKTPLFHSEYKTSSLFHHFEDISYYDDYLILNDKAMPIDWLSGAPWGNEVRRGWAPTRRNVWKGLESTGPISYKSERLDNALWRKTGKFNN